MPRFLDQVGVDNIDQYAVPTDQDRTVFVARLADLDASLTMTAGEIDTVLQLIGELGAAPTGAAMLTKLQDERDAVARQIRQWQLDTQLRSFDEPIATWLLIDPAFGGAVESSCGEEAGDPAANVRVDDGSKWAHLFDHPHEIVVDLGNPERFDAISIPIDAGANSAHLLRGVTVRAAKALSNLDDPDNELLTDEDFATAGDDNVRTFVNPKGGTEKTARYLKFTGFTTDNVNNNMRMELIRLKVLPRFFREE